MVLTKRKVASGNKIDICVGSLVHVAMDFAMSNALRLAVPLPIDTVFDKLLVNLFRYQNKLLLGRNQF